MRRQHVVPDRGDRRPGGDRARAPTPPSSASADARSTAATSVSTSVVVAGRPARGDDRRRRARPTHVVDESPPSTHLHSAAERGIVTSADAWAPSCRRSIAATSSASAARTVTASSAAGSPATRRAGGDVDGVLVAEQPVEVRDPAHDLEVVAALGRPLVRPRHQGSDESPALVLRVRGHQLDLAGRQLEPAAGMAHAQRLVEQRRGGHDACAVDDDGDAVEPDVVDHQSQVDGIRRLAAGLQQVGDLVDVAVDRRPQRSAASSGQLDTGCRSRPGDVDAP